jgi:uncharacterized protein YkwD
MRRLGHRQLWIAVALLAGLAPGPAPRADVLGAVQTLREGGCGGLVPATRPLQHSAWLDWVAERWSAGRSLATAAGQGGYGSLDTTGVHVSVSDSALLPLLRRTECRALTAPGQREVGFYRRGTETWIVLAAGTRGAQPSAPAAAAATPDALATRALQLINEARARGAWCGKRQFASVPPLSLSATLADVALGHATNMAAHNYFEHEDRAGHTPAQRVRAAGYRETLVGENIAYGPHSIEEAVRGWLDSPGHCENIMDGRFAEMGLANAPGRTSRHGLYWVQLLAAPRA